MRSRQTSTAVATFSAGNSDNDVTGSGALMMTSCAPLAEPAQNSSGLASRGGVDESWLSAGYRFGTTRTSHPGVSGAPPPGRTAYSSGGVRSSWPSAKGSASRSSAGAGSAESWPPGRPARSPAMIARCPVSGSIRTSGKRLLHRDVLDPRLAKHRATRPVAGVLIERASVGLRMEHEPAGAGGPRLGVGDLEHRRRDPAPPGVGPHGQPAELDRSAHEQQPACG